MPTSLKNPSLVYYSWFIRNVLTDELLLAPYTNITRSSSKLRTKAAVASSAASLIVVAFSLLLLVEAERWTAFATRNSGTRRVVACY